jgi:hypothetical protein
MVVVTVVVEQRTVAIEARKVYDLLYWNFSLQLSPETPPLYRPRLSGKQVNVTCSTLARGAETRSHPGAFPFWELWSGFDHHSDNC